MSNEVTYTIFNISAQTKEFIPNPNKPNKTINNNFKKTPLVLIKVQVFTLSKAIKAEDNGASK